MKWQPIHKRTGQAYPVITDQERKANWSRGLYATHFRFEEVEEAQKPEGIKPATKKETPPETGNETDLSNGQ